MEIKAFFPCEKVVERLNGSHDLLGFGISNIRIPMKKGEKMVKMTINFFSQIEFRPSEYGNKVLSVSFISPDGKTLSKSPNIEIDVSDIKSGLRIGGEFILEAEESGDHSLVLTINGDQKADWKIKVNIQKEA